jgi:hypothetical protein
MWNTLQPSVATIQLSHIIVLGLIRGKGRTMQVERRPGRFSPADVLERVLEGGIVINAADRLSVAPGPSVLEHTTSLRAGLRLYLVRAQRLRRVIRRKRRALRANVAKTRKARLAATQMIFEAVIARCAFEQARREAA